MNMKLSLGKKASLVILMVLSFSLRAQQTNKKCFLDAKNEIENMLNGTKPLDYEKAVFITENAYYDNKIAYEDFQNVLNEVQFDIEYLIKKIKSKSLIKPKKNILVSTDSAKANINRLIANYAIYNYITDTTFNIIQDKMYVHYPYSYSLNDPLGINDWRKTQVINLLVDTESEGNCMALTSLFKILSLRFNSNANLCATQGHIFVTHRDENGRLYNVELGSRSFPGTGSIETITHTTDEAARNGISMRELNLKQSVGICLMNLAKGYQHKFLTRPDAFMLDCANLILKYDSLNLNGMLLKAEVMEENLISQQKSFTKIKVSSDFKEYEKYIDRLYKLGYREMPTEMKNQIIAAITKDTTYLAPIGNRRFDPFENIANNKSRSASLSNGMFEEFDTDNPKEKYFRTVFETKTKKILYFDPIDILYNKYEFDPVAFAWQIDPLAYKYSAWSPYAALGDNPILYIDPDGKKFIDANGNEVKLVIQKTDAGTVKEVTYKFAEGTSQDIQDQFILNTGIAVRELGNTRTGTAQLEKAVNSKLKIRIEIFEGYSKDDHRENDGRDKGYFLGWTTWATKYDKKTGKYVVDDDAVVDLIIYTENIAGAIKRGGSEEGYTYPQAFGSTVGHEVEHTTAKNRQISADKQNNPNGKHPSKEAGPESIEQQIKLEYKEQKQK